MEWLAGKPLPAFCPDNPDLYVLCSQGDDGLTVGLWNLSDDTVYNAKVELAGKYSRIDFSVGEGRIEENCLVLTDPITPYSFSGFRLVF